MRGFQFLQPGSRRPDGPRGRGVEADLDDERGASTRTRYAPAHYRWLRKVETIAMLAESPAPVAFIPALPALLIDSEAVQRYPPETVAAHLIQAAVHVRYWSSGLVPDTSTFQRVTVRSAEDLLEFVSAEPSAAYLVEWAADAEARARQADVLAAHQRALDRERVGLLRLVGYPAFIVRWLQRLRDL